LRFVENNVKQIPSEKTFFISRDFSYWEKNTEFDADSIHKWLKKSFLGGRICKISNSRLLFFILKGAFCNKILSFKKMHII
jgi:hypothetical protein